MKINKMIINIKTNKGLLTIDERLKQIRIVKNQNITFIDLTQDETDFLNYWYKSNSIEKLYFKKCLKEILNDKGLFRIEVLTK